MLPVAPLRCPNAQMYWGGAAETGCEYVCCIGICCICCIGICCEYICGVGICCGYDCCCEYMFWLAICWLPPIDCAFWIAAITPALIPAFEAYICAHY